NITGNPAFYPAGYSSADYGVVLVQWLGTANAGLFGCFNQPAGDDCISFRLKVKAGADAAGTVLIPSNSNLFYFQAMNNPADGNTIYTMASQLDNIIANEATGLSPALKSFFNAVNEVANDPSSVPVRQVLTSGAGFLTQQFNTLSSRFEDLRSQTNNQMQTAVDDINSFAESIATLNSKIITDSSRASGGQLPNDLMDQRDALVAKIAEKISVSTTTQQDGSVSVFIGTGQSLVLGVTAAKLSVVGSSTDSSHKEILINGQNITQNITGGTLNGTLKFRDEILDPAQAKIFEGYYQRVLEGTKMEFEGSFRGQSYLIHAAPLRDAAGNVEQILALSINITERYQSDKKIKEAQIEMRSLYESAEKARHALLSVVEDQKLAEEKIRQLNATLEERVRDRTAQLEVANQELESFAYSVSHDLRAPLRAMDGFSAVLLSEQAERLDEQGKHYLGRIQEASRRMGQLINDLLNLSRVTRSEITYRQVDLSVLAGEIAVTLQAAEPERVVDFEIAPNLVVMGDAHLLKIALENLLGNAFKFTGKSPQGRIQVGVKELEGERVFFVRDNGAGFDMAYAGKLFAPFQRLHGLQEFPGTGIGLVTVQRIIRRHGGRIWPEAAPNAGAVFYFTIGGV
ncbi:MAG: PAS domain-containing protein, partial [Anaerolineaceae bacterium]|nr:PAS domain-containing protein [Anaerolineaceae bacterium]